MRSLLLLASLLCFGGGCAGPRGEALEVPRLDAIRIDGAGEDWGDRGLRVDVLSDSGGAVNSAADGSARMRLAWNDRGLLILLDVRDDRFVEADDAGDLSSGDSGEMHFAAEADALGLIDARIAPGRDPAHPSPRVRISPSERRLYPSTQRIRPSIEFHRTAVPDGYVLEALLPWSNLGIKPENGRTIALQVIVNDVDAPGEWHQLRFFPQRWIHERRNMHTLRLAERPSAPIRLQACAEIENLRRLKVRVDTVPELARRTVALRDGSRVLASATLQGDRPERPAGAAAILTIPLPEAPALLPDLRVVIADGPDIPLIQPDLAAARTIAFARTPIRFDSYVFSGNRFPACRFEHPGAVEDMIGRFSLATRYFDAAGNPTTRPTKPGRYGAVVECRTSAGKTYRRYATLFRSPRPLRWYELYKPEIQTLPEALGIDPRVIAQYREDVRITLGERLKETFAREPSAAAFLAWLAELPPGSEPISAQAHADAVNDRFIEMLRGKCGEGTYSYYAQVPADYERETRTRWPMILSLHGSGERGVDLAIIKRSPLAARIALRSDLPFIVISPQCPPEESWSAPRLSRLLDELMQRYRIDPDRIYVTGYSMGGYGTFSLAVESPDRFAAIAPICGGWDVRAAPRLKDLPTWVFHGDADTVVPPSESRDMVDALRKAGGRVRFTTYPGVDHDSWTPAYDDDDLYRWMLRQKRGRPEEPPFRTADTRPSTRP